MLIEEPRGELEMLNGFLTHSLFFKLHLGIPSAMSCEDLPYFHKIDKAASEGACKCGARASLYPMLFGLRVVV